jgi:hypothetical protein
VTERFGQWNLSSKGDSTMLTKTKIALATALILSSASATLAGDSDENDQGGYVIPGSVDGVNPVFHPGYFPNASKVAKTGHAGKASAQARGSYAQAYVRPSPNAEPSRSRAPTGAGRQFPAFEKNWFHFQHQQ